RGKTYYLVLSIVAESGWVRGHKALTLGEMLTNAHRHGAAHTAWIMLRWREASIILVMRDDGIGANAAYADIFAEEMGNGAGGHHGLQGMRERVAALGGEVEAGPAAEMGGFTVTLRLPFEQSDERSVQKGNRHE
ncbi:MAG: ATP-binding protein, partial [Chloroflexota bacterium]|nr:ATP-binding protein [Chloroflexota bacterium]